MQELDPGPVRGNLASQGREAVHGPPCAVRDPRVLVLPDRRLDLDHVGFQSTEECVRMRHCSPRRGLQWKSFPPSKVRSVLHMGLRLYHTNQSKMIRVVEAWLLDLEGPQEPPIRS